jgi:hypothetical protein
VGKTTLLLNVRPPLHFNFFSNPTHIFAHGSPLSGCQWKLPCGKAVDPARGRCECFQVSSSRRFHLCFPRCRSMTCPFLFIPSSNMYHKLTPPLYRLPCRYSNLDRDTSTPIVGLSSLKLLHFAAANDHPMSSIPSSYTNLSGW